jgi:haloacid dehalogenase superfamily, subfamily IA, variant 1 with third motif having Dx(3-4)D or Dx(3-4)E
MYECVIFDVDGTLIDTEQASVFSLQKVLKEEAAIDPCPEDLSFIMGVTGVEALRRLGVRNADAMNDIWNQYLKGFYHLVSVFADMEGVLKELHSMGMKTGIVTSRTRQELSDDLNRFGLHKYLPYAVCADDTQNHKPDPEPICKFVEIVNVEPGRAVYIGDTVNDLLAARGAGVDFGLAMWGSKGKELAGSKYQFASPGEIMKIIKRE